MSETQVETEAQELEPLPPAAEDENQDAGTLAMEQMEAVIAVSGKIEQFAKAMDAITGAIIKRAYEGDFVCHDREGVPENERKANIGAAAAERIAAFLGIREKNWKDLGKEWSEDRKFFTYSYEADFTFGTRTVHAIGRAGNRDKFFGKEYNQATKQSEWKSLDEVQEDDIRRAAFRTCRKEGVRTLLGLRAIPVTRLTALGFDARKIKFVAFKDAGKKLDEKDKQVDATSGLIKRNIVVKEMTKVEGVSKTNGKPWIRWDVKDEQGVKYAMFVGNGDSKRAAALQDSYGDALAVEIEFQVSKTAAGESYQIVKVKGEVDK